MSVRAADDVRASPLGLMSILKCHVTIHYPDVPLSSASPQGYSRDNNVSTRHIVPPLHPLASRPSVRAAPMPKTFGFLRQLVIPRLRFFSALTRYVFVRNSVVPSPTWLAAYLRGMKRQFIFSSDNISDSRPTEIYRVVKS